MKREIFLTGDGSSSIQIPSQNVTYHSRHGAITESMHVYIDAGFSYWHQRWPKEQTCYIFEMGFGTGLTALLTLKEAEKLQRNVAYTGIELYPLEKEIPITPFFSIKKIKASLLDFSTHQQFNIIYFDAFAPSAQRAMKAAGLEVEKLEGPPGKREMVRAGKNFNRE